MSMLSVSSGIWLDRWLKEKEDAQAKEQKLEVLEWLDTELMENDHLFGFLTNPSLANDKFGYLQALGKAKTLFKQLYCDFEWNKMIVGDLHQLGIKAINPEFIEAIDGFYYSEIRPNANRVDLKLARYNALRDELIEKTEKDENVYTEEYAKNMFGITRAEMFEKVKTNELIWALGLKTNIWNIIKISSYKQYVQQGKARIDFPIAS